MTPQRFAALFPAARCLATLAVVVSALAATPPVAAQQFKASVSFSFADNNVLRDSGETRVSSPDPYIGQSPETYFRRLGTSDFSATKMHLFLYGAADGVHPRFLPEGAVVLQLDPVAGDFRDDGTYLRINYFFADDRKTGLSLDLFPIDSDDLRLGFHYDISWGGSDTFPKHFRSGFVPGARLKLDLGSWYTFFGFKTALVRSPTEDILDNPGGNSNKIVEEARYGFLAGFGVDIIGGLRFEVNGGYFQKGTNTRQNVLGQPIHAGGFSGQLSYRRGLDIGRRIDLGLYLEDPLRYDVLAPEAYDGGVSWSVALEGTGLVQTLEDPDRVHSTHNEWSWAAMLSFHLKVGGFRVHLEAAARSLTYITYSVPGFVPYQALPEDVETEPEIWGSLSLDYFFESIGLTVAGTFGILRPATYRGVAPAGVYPPETLLQGIRKVVVRGSESGSDWDILPPGEDELPIFYVKLSLKWTFGRTFAALAEVTYGRDPNLAQVFRDSRGHAIRSFDDPDILAFGLLARLSF